jgi:hypothetical protein
MFSCHPAPTINFPALIVNKPWLNAPSPFPATFWYFMYPGRRCVFLQTHPNNNGTQQSFFRKIRQKKMKKNKENNASRA